MAEVTAKRSVAKEVEAKANKSVCLICGCKMSASPTGDEVAEGPRGLCSAHYQQFYRTMQDLPRKDRPAFEEQQIREGKILASGQLRQIKRPNPFKTVASE